MLRRIFVLLLLFVLAIGLVSCRSNNDSGLTVLTDVKGIPDKAEDSVDKSDEKDNETEDGSEGVSDEDIIINKSSKKIHLSSECGYAGTIKESNKLIRPRSELESYLSDGYSICSNCNKKYQNDD
ncbi:MAG: hypothetical protein IIU77_03965 [Clostridia bacterium]|nr:hypothetical protein [Clostridia bacterium]MBQ2252038.1 hypothetical protein [Clostridia bacterium]MBQ5601962.1 hypothetical protein [Clostridia bacterium]